MNPKMNKKTLKKDCRLKRLTFRMNIRMKYSRMNLSLLLLLLLVSINTSYSIPIENESTSLASSISLKEESQSILSPANSFMHYNPDRTWFQFATFRNPTIASDLENEKLDVWVDVEERLEENDRISDLAVNDVDRHVNSDEESDHDSVHDSESVRDGNEVGDDEDSVIQSIQSSVSGKSIVGRIRQEVHELETIGYKAKFDAYVAECLKATREESNTLRSRKEEKIAIAKIIDLEEGKYSGEHRYLTMKECILDFIMNM